MGIQQIQTEDFENAVIKAEAPVLVDFFATWCGPCKMLSPILDDLAIEVEGRAQVVKVDIDKSAELSSQYNIMSVPTLLVFENGKVKHEMVGVQSKEAMRKALGIPAS